MGKAKAQKGRVLNKEKNLSTSQGRKGLTFRDSNYKDERRNGPSLITRITKDKGSHGSKRWIFDPAKEAAKTYLAEIRNFLRANCRASPAWPGRSSTERKSG